MKKKKDKIKTTREEGAMIENEGQSKAVQRESYNRIKRSRRFQERQGKGERAEREKAKE